METLIIDMHNDLGWQMSMRWLRLLEHAYAKNMKWDFVRLLKMREKNLYYFNGDNNSQDRFLNIVNLGIIKFHLEG
jgi:hypothetical protein